MSSTSDQDEKSEITLDYQLEAPPPVETPVSSFEQQHGGIFAPDDEGLALLNAKFTVLDQFMSLLARDIKFQDMMREILLIIMKVLKCEAGSVIEVDYLQKVLFFRAVVGQSSDSITKFTIPLGQGIVGHVAESKQMLVVDNAEENAMHLKAIAKAVGFDTRNLIAVPIVVRGQVYGVLELLNRIGEPNFTAADQQLLSYFCEALGKTLEIRFMLAWASRNAQDNEPSQGEDRFTRNKEDAA